MGCSCGGCFLQVSRGAMYNMLCTEIMWTVGIVGECVIELSSRKLRV